MKNKFQMCSKTVMDTSDPDILFDTEGVSNHYHNYFKRQTKLHYDKNFRDVELTRLIKDIKSITTNDYNCIIGVSGGVDSTYVCYLAKKHGLKPLAIHFDNGWNSEIAVSNIEKTLKELEIELYTYVVDWFEFRDLQLSFLKASTPDGEVPTDHGMISLLYKMANKLKIKYVLTGVNFQTESLLPIKWGYGYFDLKYIKGVQKKFGSFKLKTYPMLSLFRLFYYSKIKKIRFIPFLNYFEYDKKKAIEIIESNLGWVNYGGKHYESRYTRFFQSYILPVKFNIDKRKAHLSNLICSNQITRDDAIKELQIDLYPQKKFLEDKKFVLNKFDMSETEFEELMNLDRKLYSDYKNNSRLFNFLKFLKNTILDKLNIKLLEIG